MRVYLDTDTEHQIPLECLGLRPERWNGYVVPIATAEQMATFVAAWRSADPNGTWGETYIRVHDGALVVTRNDSSNPDDWEVWEASTWRAYDVVGWTWITKEDT